MGKLLHFLTHGAPLLALFPLIATNGIKLSVLIVEVTGQKFEKIKAIMLGKFVMNNLIHRFSQD